MRKIKMKPKIEDLKESRDQIELLIECIEETIRIEPETTDEYILLKYIENQSGTVVAEILNKEGVRIEQRKYIPNDITAVIKNKESNAREEIKGMALLIYQYYTMKASWNSIIKWAEKQLKTELK